ncbi:hypothetical protein ACP70R_026919 [Stipagrostis hirtigluma subsp. patula]
MIDVFIHEEYVHKRREQRQRQMRPLQVETEKKKKLPPRAAASQGSTRDLTASASPDSPVGSPTADAASFHHHLFDYL